VVQRDVAYRTRKIPKPLGRLASRTAHRVFGRVPRHPTCRQGFRRAHVPRPFILPSASNPPQKSGPRRPGGAPRSGACPPASRCSVRNVARSGQAICTGEDIRTADRTTFGCRSARQPWVIAASIGAALVRSRPMHSRDRSSGCRTRPDWSCSGETARRPVVADTGAMRSIAVPHHRGTG